MPIGPTRTKAEKQKVMHTEMHKFKEGDLHSGSKHGPKVKSRAQAIAIGLNESHQSKYDRSGHHPGNPGFNREGKAPYREYNGGAHAKQPHGKSIGVPDIDKPHNNQSYAAEQREHWGSEASGETRGSGKEVGHTGPADRGSELVENCGMGHDKQPHGKSIGAGTHGAEHHKGHTFGGVSHSFSPPKAESAHGFGHTHRSGHLRMSGHSGAHRVGHRGK